jgi:hypothetical protein
MSDLIAKANQAMLEAQCLRREGRSLRFEATVLASQLGQTVMLSQRVEEDLVGLKASLDRAFSKP